MTGIQEDRKKILDYYKSILYLSYNLSIIAYYCGLVLKHVRQWNLKWLLKYRLQFCLSSLWQADFQHCCQHQIYAGVEKTNNQPHQRHKGLFLRAKQVDRMSNKCVSLLICQS